MGVMTYYFGADKVEGLNLGKILLGGKGANLVEMASLGIPVPPGIVITTEACKIYAQTNKFPEGLEKQIDEKLKLLEKTMGHTLGGSEKPLLVSVRSGAPVSMPGMMDTILNLGLNEKSLLALSNETKNQRFALDSYRRFLQMFSNVVLEIDHHHFEDILSDAKNKAGVKQDFELTPASLLEIVKEYKALVKRITGEDFPDDVQVQLRKAIEAVFRSWNNERAIFYRKLNNIPHDLGTAVVIQSMVFGNMSDDSGTGVAFTRNPSTGENKFYGEYLLNAQGEDVVAGIRTPNPIQNLEKEMPDVYKNLFEIQKNLEKHFGDMQDIEFTIQNRKLYLLQTRNGKRTAQAALRIAIEMVEEGKITKKTALKQVNPEGIPSLLAPIFIAEPKKEAIKNGKLIAKGLNAGPGAAAGKLTFDSKTATEWAEKGENVLLVRQETSPEDIMGMQHARGILTARGGMTSHAAVVARGMNKPCVVGCSALQIDHAKKTMSVEKDGKRLTYKEGDLFSIDGSTGEVIEGLLPTQASEIDQYLSGKLQGESSIAENFLKLMSWADEVRTLKIRANADTPTDAKVARTYGAQGIGLCRTEHMFFEGTRITFMRQMILSETKKEREAALEKLLVYQEQDFVGIFEAMDGLPVTIRLLDPPLHEFLPHTPAQIEELSKKLNLSTEEVNRRSNALKEENPMLGHRGCRLGITFPEITRMQTLAIIRAAINVQAKGKKVLPEIMVPLVGHPKEFELQKKVIDDAAAEVFKNTKTRVEYMVGTMIEVPRAALQADKIAKSAEFFSFGTNDLTQATLAFSRDDSGTFLNDYLNLGIYEISPFQTIDQDGVGEMVKIAIDRGKRVRPEIKLGVCGEHGGDPMSIQFFHDVGLNYVSCSPFRVAVARLAAARSVLVSMDKN